MRHRLSALVTTGLALVAAVLAFSAAPASAAVDGFQVTFGQAPATFTIGQQARTVTASVATDRQRRCVKVRWALVITTDGVSLDQVRVNRVENGQSFRVRAQLGADAARITDTQADPGQLCRNQTDSAQWDISFTGPDNGRVTLAAQALDLTGRELATAESSSRVVTAVADKPSDKPSATSSARPTPTEAATEEPVADDQDTPAAKATTSSAALTPTGGTPSVLGPGLIIGAVLVFLGVALLLRIRTRNRRGDGDPAWQAQTQSLPTGFYSMPDRRRRR
jgi:hypothetical protein